MYNLRNTLLALITTCNIAGDRRRTNYRPETPLRYGCKIEETRIKGVNIFNTRNPYTPFCGIVPE